MIPIKLRMRNFMCYRDNVPPLLFDGIHTACVSGDNGNGKSTLIDAMTWALWGQARTKSDDDLIYDDQKVTVINPSAFPAPTEIEKIEEPWISISVITPSDYIGPLMELITGCGGSYKQTEYLGQNKSLGKINQRVRLKYEMPLRSMLTTFYDQLKSRSRGFASLDYELIGNRETRLVKLDVLVNDVVVDAFSRIVPPEKVHEVGKAIVAKLKEVIPRQLFKVSVQAAVGSRIVAREDISAKRKDVLAKCYGGDITRKRKLLEKQKEGKKKMKYIGRVEVPKEAFLDVLKLG